MFFFYDFQKNACFRYFGFYYNEIRNEIRHHSSFQVDFLLLLCPKYHPWVQCMFKWNNHEKKRKVSTYQALGHILLCDYTLQLAIEHGAYEKNPPGS
jgi:hypothetical protein